MSAYLTYEIHGKARSGHVTIQVRALTKPDQEAAEWLIREKYPSARDVIVTIPAAHHYPKIKVKPIKASTLTTTPARRTS